MKKKIWNHKKNGKKFTGFYKRLEGDRVFNLTNGKRTITFESHEAAKKAGWTAA